MANVEKFNDKIFNPNVFEAYRRTLQSTKENALIKSSIFTNVNKYRAKMSEQAGGYFVTEPIKGRIGGEPVNYDGKTDIVTSGRETYFQTKICYGRANGWKEEDFNTEITGTNFMAEAGEVNEYWDEQRQKTVLSILKGIFSMTGSNNFANRHTYTVDGNLTADGLNRATQKALGDKKKKLDVIFMHSAVSTNLEGLNLIEFMKYTDKNGITRDLNIGTYNGRLVVVDDDMPTIEGTPTYTKTTDTSINSSKTYYTRSGSAGNYTYTEVTSPVVGDIGNYYEMTDAGETQYISYVFANGFFEFENLGVKVPSELVRQAKEKGGYTELITREREMIVPTYISYTDTTKISPENSDFEKGENWEVVNNAKTGNEKLYVDSKLIPIVRIVSKG